MVYLLEALFRLPRGRKRVIQLTTDSVLIALSFLLAMMLRVGSWEPIPDIRIWAVLLFMVPVSLAIFIRLGFYRAVIRYMSVKAIQAVLAGVFGSAITLALTSFILGLDVPRSVPFIYAMLAFITIGGIRFCLRAIYLRGQYRQKTRVVVYGAGAAGRQLVVSLRMGNEYAPAAFIDDCVERQKTHIEGLKVYPASRMRHLMEDYGVEHVLLAMPSASRARRREILEELSPLGVPVQTIPGMADVITGNARINEIRDVAVEDLLGRDPVPPEPTLMAANIRDKVVMVTGAGGSIGSELCRQILRQKPSTLLLLEICEYSLYSIEQELKQAAAVENLQVSIKALLGSVQHRHRAEEVMQAFRVQTIYHAAAYKHVPIVEHNLVEGVRNNVFGTLEIARAAVNTGVETFVLVSTDKAVRPTNVMGTTKRLAELICQALAQRQDSTRFCMVRFGNVLGSSGSVVPLFRRQILDGGPITVTHPDITRYFMTIPEAAQLVIQAGAMGRGGDVFVLDMGEPVRIAELARQMVRLSGLEVADAANPDGDISIIYTGLRPGEKLYEELLIGDDVTNTAHPRILSSNENYWEWRRLGELLARLSAACLKFEYPQIREILMEAPTAYSPSSELVDLVWMENDKSSVPPVASPEPAMTLPSSNSDGWPAAHAWR